MGVSTYPQKPEDVNERLVIGSLATSSATWPSICTVRRNTQLTKSARRSASQGRRFTSMSRRLATDDVRLGACRAENAESAGYRLGAGVLPTLRPIRHADARMMPPGTTDRSSSHRSNSGTGGGGRPWVAVNRTRVSFAHIGTLK